MSREARVTMALIDTSAFYVLVDAHDEHHCRARQTAEQLARARTRLITTGYIVAETHALILNRMRRIDLALAIANHSYTSQPGDIVTVSAEQRASALILLNRYQDKAFTFTDATSFVIMEELGLTHVFTFDHNFEQHGFTLL